MIKPLICDLAMLLFSAVLLYLSITKFMTFDRKLTIFMSQSSRYFCVCVFCMCVCVVCVCICVVCVCVCQWRLLH